MQESYRSKLNKVIDSMESDMIESVQRLVKIKSVKSEPQPDMPFGAGSATALSEALKIARNIGFKTTNLKNYIGYAEYGSGERMIAVLGHVDVVPEGSGWTFPPYSAEIHDNKIYGRGTADDKGPIVAALYALKALKDLGFEPTHRIRLLFGTDEESGSEDVKYYLDHGGEIPVAGFTPDAMYPVVRSEKGIITFEVTKEFGDSSTSIVIKKIKGGEAANIVPNLCECELLVKDNELKNSIIRKCHDFSEEKKYDIKIKEEGNLLTLTSKGVSAHAMEPEKGKNAIMQLITFLDILSLDNQDVKYFISFLSNSIGMETDGTSLSIKCEDDTGNLTLNVGMIDSDEHKGQVSINLRYPCTFKGNSIMEKIIEASKAFGIGIKLIMDQPPLYFPVDHPLIKILMRVFEEQTGQKGLYPLSIGGGTYAKALPNIVGFGPLFPGEPAVEHQPNEYFKIDDLKLNVKIYAQAIYELDKNIGLK